MQETTPANRNMRFVGNGPQGALAAWLKTKGMGASVYDLGRIVKRPDRAHDGDLLRRMSEMGRVRDALRPTNERCGRTGKLIVAASPSDD